MFDDNLTNELDFEEFCAVLNCISINLNQN
jgi:hypothetical protein